MLNKSPRSAWILSAACAAAIFLMLLVLQPPDVRVAGMFEGTLFIGLVLFFITSLAFFTMIARAEERYYGLWGLAGWVLTGVLLALALGWIQRVYPSTFGLIGVAVIGFVLFRWLSFELVWKIKALTKGK
jgi:hypothetical protein